MEWNQEKIRVGGTRLPMEPNVGIPLEPIIGIPLKLMVVLPQEQTEFPPQELPMKQREVTGLVAPW